MGGNSSSSHVSFSQDEEEGEWLVKGIRLSERVINRMRETPHPHATSKSSPHSPTSPPAARQAEGSAAGERHVPIMPHAPSYASASVPPPPSEPITGDEHAVLPEPSSITPPQPDRTPVEPITSPSGVSSESVTPPPCVNPTSTPDAPLTRPVNTNPAESLATPLEPVVEPVDIETPLSSLLAAGPTALEPIPSPVEPAVSPSSPPLVESVVSNSASASVVVSPHEMPSMVETGPFSAEEDPAAPLPPAEEFVTPPFVDSEGPFTSPPQTQTTVNEEELRKQIKEELQKSLKEEMKMEEQRIKQQLEEEKAKAVAQAQAAARLQVKNEVQKVLKEEEEEEEVSYQLSLADAIRREQLNLQDERLIAQYYWMERKAQKLEEKEKDLEKQDALFRKQIATLQEKAAQLTKVTSENYKRGLEDTHKRFRRHQMKPVCSDLQSQILKCYAENKGQTLTCSNIASLYIQCVDSAKQDKKSSIGG